MPQERANLVAALRALEEQGWFSQRSEATRAKLGAIAKLRNFSKNELVYLAGDAPNGVFGLVSGSLNVSFPQADGHDYTMHRAGRCFWVGDLALFSEGPRLVSVRAAEPTQMVQLPAKELARLVRDDPQLYADGRRGSTGARRGNVPIPGRIGAIAAEKAAHLDIHLIAVVEMPALVAVVGEPFFSHGPMQEAPVAETTVVGPDTAFVQQALVMVAVARRRHVVEVSPHIEEFARPQVPQRQVQRRSRCVCRPCARVLGIEQPRV